MKNIKILTWAAALLATAGFTGSAHATSTTNKVSLTVNIFRQGDTVQVPNSPIQIYKLKKNVATTKDLLGLLATATGNPAVSAKGNVLEVDGDVDSSPLVLVKSPAGAVIANVTSFFTLTLDSLDVYGSVYNSATEAETSTDYFLVTVSFNDHAGNDFTISGMAIDRYAASAYRNGQQTVTSLVTANLSGRGHLGAQEAVVSGTIRLTGRSIER